MRSTRTKTRGGKRRVEPSICTMQDVEGTGLMITTKVPKKQSPRKKIPPPQNPPQGEYLADEYVHNLQQQLYFLDAEIRFVQDRAGVDTNEEGPSVDSAIRRLRRAISMYEEETNKKIKDLQEQTEQLREENDDVDEAGAVDVLTQANKFEMDELQKHEIAYVDSASPINLKQVQVVHTKVMEEYNNQQQQVLDQAIEEQKAMREQHESEISKAQVGIVEERDKRKALIQQIKTAYENKYNAMEQKDLLQIIEKEPEYKAPNLHLDTIKSRNAKLEMEIESIREMKKETIKQLGELLLKNAKLGGDLNVLKAKAERGRSIKHSMEKNFNGILAEKQKENAETKEIIEQLRKKKRELKEKIADYSNQCNTQFGILNEIESECELLKGTITFKKSQIEEVEKENEVTVNEISEISANVEDARKNLDQLATTISEAEEKMMQLESEVASNAKDPRCCKLNPPKELASLLENLNAVKKQIDE